MSSDGVEETLSVIVPATGIHPTLAQCLDAISRSTEPPDELIVVTLPAVSSASAAGRGRNIVPRTARAAPAC